MKRGTSQTCTRSSLSGIPTPGTKERPGAEFWTADRHLANNARQGDATWVHWGDEIDYTGKFNTITHAREMTGAAIDRITSRYRHFSRANHQ